EPPTGKRWPIRPHCGWVVVSYSRSRKRGNRFSVRNRDDNSLGQFRVSVKIWIAPGSATATGWSEPLQRPLQRLNSPVARSGSRPCFLAGSGQKKRRCRVTAALEIPAGLRSDRLIVHGCQAVPLTYGQTSSAPR